MTISLIPVRFFTGNEPSHYTVDNLPLIDLDNNINIIKEAVDGLSDNVIEVNQQGNWSGFVLNLPLTSLKNTSFAFNIKLFVKQNKANLHPQTSAYFEIFLIGSNDNAGNVRIASSNIAVNLQSVGSVTPTLTPTNDGIDFTFSGYTGGNGYALLKASRLAINPL